MSLIACSQIGLARSSCQMQCRYHVTPRSQYQVPSYYIALTLNYIVTGVAEPLSKHIFSLYLYYFKIPLLSILDKYSSSGRSQEYHDNLHTNKLLLLTFLCRSLLIILSYAIPIFGTRNSRPTDAAGHEIC